MVADARFGLSGAVRTVVGTVLYPIQWLAMRPVELARGGGAYFESLQKAQQAEKAADVKLAEQSMRASQVEQLALENTRLRKLLELRDQVKVTTQAAEVLHDAADIYSRKVIIDKGLTHGIKLGSPVADENGVLGQVTQVHSLVSEVTLLVDRDQAIPVLNTRTGARSVAFGEPVVNGGVLELRFIPANADVQEGDLLTTSGVDGIYPPGLPVAKITSIERRANSAFAQIYCQPQALIQGSLHVLVMEPQPIQLPVRDDAAAAKPATKTSKPVKGSKR